MAMGLFDLSNLQKDKDETINRLTQEILQLNEKCSNLEQVAHQAQADAKASKERALDAEDTTRLKDKLIDDLEQSLNLAEERANSLADQVSAREMDLRLLREDMDKHPISDKDLLHRFEKQAELFELLEEALTCPICYSPFSRGQAVSLLCGHAFCETCFSEWEAKHLATFKMSPQQGAYYGAECPECRSQDVRRGRVRIFALEEVVRLVERGMRDLRKPYHASSSPVPPPTPPAEDVLPSTTLQPHNVPDEMAIDQSDTSDLASRNAVLDSAALVFGTEAQEPAPEVRESSTDRGMDVETPQDITSSHSEAELEPEQISHSHDQDSSEIPIDEDAARILRPRTSAPYVKVFSRRV